MDPGYSGSTRAKKKAKNQGVHKPICDARLSKMIMQVIRLTYSNAHSDHLEIVRVLRAVHFELDAVPLVRNARKAFAQLLEDRLILQGAALGTRPDRQAEPNLVHEVGKVVHRVQHAVIDGAQQVPEEVAKGVDRPADGDDEPHGVERGLDVLIDLVAASSGLASLTGEDLLQDVPPAAQAAEEADPGPRAPEQVGLAAVAERQRHNGADQQAPEHAGADVGLHRLED